MSPSLDWLYQLAGWTLAAAGLLLLLWSLFWDRSRGRRRCPKCWYDMGGVPGLKCPECGREARSEKCLGRSRRRCGFALVALMVVYTGFAVRRTQREGWSAVVPTLALLAGVRWLPTDPTAAQAQWLPSAVDHSPCGWCGRALERRLPKSVPSWQLALAWRVAYARIDADLNRYPPVAPALGAVSLMSHAFATDYPVRDERANGLVAVELRGPAVAPKGAPLCFVADFVGFGDTRVIVDLKADWDGADWVRSNGLTPDGQFLEMMISYPGDYYEPVVCLGRPPRECEGINVTARFRRANGTIRPFDQLPVVATRRFRVPVRVVPAELATLEPVQAPWPLAGWTRDEVAVMSRRPYHDGEWELRFTSMLVDGSPPPDVTFGARVEIRSGETEYFRGQLCWWKDIGKRAFPWGFGGMGPLSGAYCDLVPVRPLAGDPTTMVPWNVRLIGDQDVARWNTQATRYWAGNAELPLTIR